MYTQILTSKTKTLCSTSQKLHKQEKNYKKPLRKKEKRGKWSTISIYKKNATHYGSQQGQSETHLLQVQSIPFLVLHSGLGGGGRGGGNREMGGNRGRWWDGAVELYGGGDIKHLQHQQGLINSPKRERTAVCPAILFSSPLSDYRVR